MRVVVADTGPLLHLAEARLLGLFDLLEQVFIPPEVERELLRYPSAGITPPFPSWLRVTSLSPSSLVEAGGWVRAGFVDEGEAHAIALARQIKADWLLTDDAAARLLARPLGLEVHGSLGVVLWSAAAGHLRKSEALAALDRLAASTLWMTPRVLDEARRGLQGLSDD